MTDLGLISVLPVTFLFAFLVLMGGYIFNLTRTNLHQRILFLYNLALIFIIHGTPNIVYATVRYPWAYKHIGIVEYITRNSGINPYIKQLNIYHNWPGFFGLGALLTENGGYPSAMTFAGWAPVFFNTMFICGLLVVFGALTKDRRVVWLGAWLFLLTNWIGQDYFAPQAFAYFLYLVILGILLKYYNRHRPFPWQMISKPLLLHWLSFITRRLSRLSQGGRPNEEVQLTTAQDIGLKFTVLLLFLVISASHQLTPFMGVLSVMVLVIFGYCKWRSLPWLMLGIALAWIAFPAWPYSKDLIHDLTGSFGQFGSNVQNSFINLSVVNPQQMVVAVMGRLLSGVVGVIAFVGAVRRLMRGYLDLAVVALAVAPIPILAANGYGGEVLFRVYFFSLPFLVFLAAESIYPGGAAIRDVRLRSRSSTAWGIPTAITIMSLFLSTGFSFAYYGKDAQYFMSPKELDAASFLYHIGPPNSLIVEGAHNYPSLFYHYEYFSYVSIDREPPQSVKRVLDNPTDVLANWLSNEDFAKSYLIITRSMKIYTDAIGSLPPGALNKLEQQLNQSPQFIRIFHNEDASIYTYRKP
jgi:hypothetical protein